MRQQGIGNTNGTPPEAGVGEAGTGPGGAWEGRAVGPGAGRELSLGELHVTVIVGHMVDGPEPLPRTIHMLAERRVHEQQHLDPRLPQLVGWWRRRGGGGRRDSCAAAAGSSSTASLVLCSTHQPENTNLLPCCRISKPSWARGPWACRP